MHAKYFCVAFILLCVCVNFVIGQNNKIIFYPCDNIRNFIRFEKVENNNWRIFIDFNLYCQLKRAELIIIFFQYVKFESVSTTKQNLINN